MENRFAAARRRYLRTHMDGIYTGMLLTETLEPHLEEIGESVHTAVANGHGCGAQRPLCGLTATPI